jgi:tRNA A-37 threonylcarbamoyl transferase component Bud32
MSTDVPVREFAGERYVVERPLGRGGVGEVYLAYDRQLDRWVAVKCLHTATEAASERAEAAIREARRLAALHHPNIVTVFDVVRDGDDVAVVMEYVHGHTLEDYSGVGPFSMADFRELARQALDGLAAAHATGMIHRDIKASNIMLAKTQEGAFRVKILDFGLAKIQAEPSLQTMDQSGSLMGSIYSMAPEQLEQLPLDVRTDLYALGCVLYQTLANKVPFRGESVPAVITAHLQHRFEPLMQARPDVPPALAAWVERLFAREPDERPGSAVAAWKEFEAAEMAGKATPATMGAQAPQVGTRPVGTRPVTQVASAAPAPKKRNMLPVAAVAAVVVIVGGFAWLLQGGNKRPDAQTEEYAGRIYAPEEREALLAALGSDVVVRGTAGRLGINKSGTIRFLNFVGTSRGDLSLVFFLRPTESEFTEENLSRFVGREISVRGTLTEYGGDPQIQIASLDQIRPVE